MVDEIAKSIIDTLIAEAGGQGEESMRRVAETILNRSAIRGLSPEQVVQQPYQYTGYSNPGPAARQAQQMGSMRSAAEAAWRLAQQPGDPTGGADHYYAHGTISQPSWARGMTPTGEFGGHNYYSSRPIPPGEIPNQVASLTDTVRPTYARPATQSNALSSQRSLIPSSGSDALKSAMARLAGQSVRNVSPARQSPDLAQMRNPIMSSSARNAQVTPYPVTQSLDLAIRRTPGETIETIPTSGIGAPPATRSVQSIPMTGNNQSAMVEATRRAALMANPSYVERSPPVQNRPALVQDAARRAALLANQSYVERSPPLSQARLAPGVAAQNYDIGINGPSGLTRQHFAALNSLGSIPPRQSAPMPLMASSMLQSRRAAPLARGVNQAMAPMLPQVRQAPQYGLPIASAPPLRVVVDGANVRGGQSAPMQIAGFTNDGSGRLTSNETGGVYYERHLR